MKKLDNLISRLLKIGIDLKLVANVPWIYVDSINGIKIKETFESDYGFVLGYLSIKDSDDCTINKELFALIRRTLNNYIINKN